MPTEHGVPWIIMVFYCYIPRCWVKAAAGSGTYARSTGCVYKRLVGCIFRIEPSTLFRILFPSSALSSSAVLGGVDHGIGIYWSILHDDHHQMALGRGRREGGRCKMIL